MSAVDRKTTDAVQAWEHTVGGVADWRREHPGATMLKEHQVSAGGQEYAVRHLRRPDGFARVGGQEYALFTTWHEPDPLTGSTAGVKTAAARISWQRWKPTSRSEVIA